MRKNIANAFKQFFFSIIFLNIYVGISHAGLKEGYDALILSDHGMVIKESSLQNSFQASTQR